MCSLPAAVAPDLAAGLARTSFLGFEPGRHPSRVQELPPCVSLFRVAWDQAPDGGGLWARAGRAGAQCPPPRCGAGPALGRRVPPVAESGVWSGGRGAWTHSAPPRPRKPAHTPQGGGQAPRMPRPLPPSLTGRLCREEVGLGRGCARAWESALPGGQGASWPAAPAQLPPRSQGCLVLSPPGEALAMAATPGSALCSLGPLCPRPFFSL